MRALPILLLVRVVVVFRCVAGGAMLADAPPPVVPPTAPAVPPLPAPTSTPVDFFRELLAAAPTSREKLLLGRSAEQRKVLENSVRAYERLSPEERELRLRTLELRFRLNSLLRATVAVRQERLKLLPESDRALLGERLRVWEQFSPEDQRALLENEQIIGTFCRPAVASPRHNLPLSGQTSNQLRQIELQLVRWQSLPEPRRTQIERNFRVMYELTDHEKTMHQLQPLDLSPQELQVMEKSLAQFRSLAPAQRQQCIRNFEKFVELSPGDRRQFLASAQEWQRMTAQDREAWRKLVSRMPPLPPRISRPPLPPTLRPESPTVAFDTNRQR